MVFWTTFMLQTIDKSRHFVILIFPFLNYFTMFNMVAIKKLLFETSQAIIFDEF